MDERVAKSTDENGPAGGAAVAEEPPLPEARAFEDAGQPGPGKSGGAAAERPQPKTEPQDRGRSDAGGGTEKPRKGLLRRHPVLVIIAVLVLIAAAVAAVLWYLNARHFEYTDDAFIDARQFPISPKVSGYLIDVPVTDNQFVHAGDVIARIDPRDYENALAQAEAQRAGAGDQIVNIDAQISSQQAQVEQAQAQIEQAQGSLVFAQQQFDRSQALVKTGSGTVQTAQQNQSNLKTAQADFTRAKAALVSAKKQIDVLKAQRASAVTAVAADKAARDQAKLNLEYTTIRAAQAGHIAKLTGAKGQYVQPGQNISMFVPDPLWVTANFKETQITDMRRGQPVDIEIDAYPGRKLQGKVASIQPGSGTAFSLLPAENATGNYVKVVQRIPVKITFDKTPDDIVLGPGMSVVPSVRVR